MKKLVMTILMVLLLSGQGWGATVPLNNFSEQEVSGNQTTQTIYSYPKYYDNSGKLEEINTAIVPSTDAGWDWEVKSGVYKLRIKSDGTFEVNHLGDIFTQQLKGIGFYNSATEERQIKQSPVLSSPVVSGNTITWTLPLGCSYQIIYSNDNLKDVLVLSQTAKDWLKARVPTWAAQDVFIGLIYDFDSSKSSMIESKDFNTDGDIRFVRDGRVKHRIRGGTVKHELFSASDTVDKQWTKKKILKNGVYVEAVRATALDSVSGFIKFNTDYTFQEGVSSYSGCVDSLISSVNTTTNYGTNYGTNAITNQNNSAFLIKFDLSSLPSGKYVTAATLSVYEWARGNNSSLNCMPLLRNWVESEVTYNVYSAGNNWSTAGALSIDNDYQDWGSRVANQNPGWLNFGLFKLAKLWYTSALSNYGVIIRRDSGDNFYDNIYLSEDTTDSSLRPKITISLADTDPGEVDQTWPGQWVVARDESNSPPGEKPVKLVDNSSSTKWLELKTGGTPFWFTWKFGAANDFRLGSYKITTANDATERDPKTWTIAGSNTGAFAGEETIVDTVEDGALSDTRAAEKTFTCDSPPATAFAYYRWTISDLKNLTTANSTQVAEIELYVAEESVTDTYSGRGIGRGIMRGVFR